MRRNLQVLQEEVQMRQGDLAATQPFVGQQAEVFTSLKQVAERQVEASKQFLAAATSGEEMYTAEANRVGEACKVLVRHAVLHACALANCPEAYLHSCTTMLELSA